MTPKSQTTIYKKYLKELQHLSVDSLQTIVDESQEIIDRAQARQSAARDCLVEALVLHRLEQEKVKLTISQETINKMKDKINEGLRKTVCLLLLLCPTLQAESVRIQWDAPVGNPQPIPSSYGVFVYKCCQACSSTDCNIGAWCEAPLENTNSTQTHYAVTRPPGQYMFMVGYYINGVFQGARSNSLCYTIKVGEVAAPPPPTNIKNPTNLRFP